MKAILQPKAASEALPLERLTIRLYFDCFSPESVFLTAFSSLSDPQNVTFCTTPPAQPLVWRVRKQLFLVSEPDLPVQSESAASF